MKRIGSNVITQLKINMVANSMCMHKESFISPIVCDQFARILARLKML